MKPQLSNKLLIVFLILCGQAIAQGPQTSTELENRIKQTMLGATQYMVEEVSTNGGYLWNYLPDFSRRWGEMEAFKTMIWVQHPGTASMGHVFLDAYSATGDEYYYEAAEKAAAALIWGQSNEGGWNYIIDFAGDRSLKHWYDTIGKNGWRLEEFQHYYGNSTFDDDVTSNAARFLLRLYLQKMDPAYKPALDKAIDFILESQYPLGGWPQRYPLKYDFVKKGLPDYSSFYTFNDDVIWENINFLIQCYLTLGEQRFLDPIRRGMNFYMITQHGSGAWGQQYNMELEPTGARTYEPPALMPRTTYGNAMLLMRFYEHTGDRKFLARVPDAINWLENARLPEDMTEGGEYTHPLFVDIDTNEPIFVHRKGSNVVHGYYYYDNNADDPIGHYGAGNRSTLDIGSLWQEYERLNNLSPEEATKNSPIKVGTFNQEGTPQNYYDLNPRSSSVVPDTAEVREIINSLDNQNRWLVKNVRTSNPYIGDGQNQELTDEYATTYVGDETDTSPYEDTSEQEYISTGAYIQNMNLLINYLGN